MLKKTKSELVTKAMELNLTPTECHIWYFLYCSKSHGIEINLLDALVWLEVELADFMAIVSLFEYHFQTCFDFNTDNFYLSDKYGKDNEDYV